VSASADAGKLRVPGEVVQIARTLVDAGYETWCVGGAVRDALLGVVSLDWDLATAATPPVVRRLFKRTVPVGIEFGTVGVLDARGIMHEVTTFRRDVHTDGRHAVVEFGASLDEDLARRDFTINAIAFDPLGKRMHDPFDGRGDLVARRVRAVGDAEARLGEDRLRALRAIRFAARFDFEIEAATWTAILGSAAFLARLSPERVKQEIEKTMEQVAAPSRALRRWRDSGALAALVPAIGQVSDVTLSAIDCVPRPGPTAKPFRRSLRIALLLSEMDGAQASTALRALRFSNSDAAWIGALVSAWHDVGPSMTATWCASAEPGDPELRRLAARVGRVRVSAVCRLAAARWAALRGAALPSPTPTSTPTPTPTPTQIPTPIPTPARVRSVYRRALRIAFRDPIEVADLAIDGDDLRGAGIPAGPLYGRLLAALLHAVVESPPLNTREILLERAQVFAANEG